MARGRGLIMITTLVSFLFPLLILADHHHVYDPESATMLAARLKHLMVDSDQAAAAAPSYCWESLVQLQSCTGEAIMFFLNGEAYLGEACCTAIRTIARHCWPDMLQALGFTAVEGDMLEDYCADHHNDQTGTHYSLHEPAKEPAAAPVLGSAEVFDGTTKT